MMASFYQLLSLCVVLEMSHTATVNLNSRINSQAKFADIKRQYQASLEYPLLTPNITQVAITPESVKQCWVKGVSQCYHPLMIQPQSRQTENICYLCEWVCKKANIKTYDKFDWINTKYTSDNSTGVRYDAITRVVRRIQLPDGSYGLSSDKDFGQLQNGAAKVRIDAIRFSYDWNNDSRIEGIPNGTLSFRFHLNTSNIHQNPDVECQALDIYRYQKVALKLKCNKDNNNMDLYLSLPTKEIPILIEKSVLNDSPVPAVDNSIHIAHAIDTVSRLSAIYVNGRLVHSAAPYYPSPNYKDHILYAEHGLSGVLYDFFIYRQALTKRLVNEVYLKQSLPVDPARECYCPTDHPIFLPNSTAIWTGNTCAALKTGDLSNITNTILSKDTVIRNPGVTNSSENLIKPNAEEYWISGEGGEAEILLSLDRFYHVLAIVFRVQTLPARMTISTRQTVLQYGHNCPSLSSLPQLPRCELWSKLTVYTDLMVVDLSKVVERHNLRSDRVKLEFEGHYNSMVDKQPYIMKGIEIIAECGCLTDRGSCMTVPPAPFRCDCHDQFTGEYCEKCSDGYTSQGIDCVPCGCNTEGAVNQMCDPTMGACTCKSNIDQKLAGPKCNPYLTESTPNIGPIAGGTVLNLKGMLLNQVTNVSIGELPCRTGDPRNGTILHCATSSTSTDMLYNVTEIALTIASGDQYLTSKSFQYHNNPNITTISRTKTFQSGGLSVRFSGEDLEAVYSPKLLLHIVCDLNPNSILLTYEQRCTYDPILTEQYTCILPNFKAISYITNICIPEKRERRRRETETNQQNHHTIWLGLQLDGYTAFQNLSEVDWLNADQLNIYPDPVFYNFTDEKRIRVIPIIENLPELTLNGENLDLGAEASDYVVTIGAAKNVKCEFAEVADDTVLRCLLPKVLPPAEPNAPAYTKDDHNQPVPFVKIEAGNLQFEVGFIFYNRVVIDDVPVTMIVSVVVVLVLVIAAVVIGLLFYRRHINIKRKRQQRLVAGFDLVEAANSLQTQVQSILIEENLFEPLLARVIPASFISQDSIVGQGHFGQVYKGRLFIPERKINKAIAVKALKPSGLTAKDVVNFVKEALLMKDFNHVNVLQLIGIVYEASDPESLPLVVLPLMEKGDLKTLISDELYEFSAGDLLHFGLQVSGGMTYLSNLKFIHRDLRAANCMVDATFIVKIGDFGLSHDVSESDYYRPQDKSKPLPVKWMALEVLSETSKYTTQSDVWSFGVLLWELMTRGYQPYADVQNSQIKNYIMNGHRLHKLDFIPEQIYDIMISCWTIDPLARPTFADLTTTIAELLKQADGSAHGYQTEYTSTLPSVDYLNADSMDRNFQSGKIDEWSAIIPLIKAQTEYYADTGRNGDDEDSDTSEGEILQGRRDLVPPSHNRNPSINREIMRMGTDSTKGNDYGQVDSSDEKALTVDLPAATEDSIQSPSRSLENLSFSSVGSEPPPLVPRRPTDFNDDFVNSDGPRTRRLESQTAIEFEDVSDSSNSLERIRKADSMDFSPMDFINSICDSLPTPSLERLNEVISDGSTPRRVKSKLTTKVPAKSLKNYKWGGSGNSVVYEEALEVKCPILDDSPVPANNGNLKSTTVTPDLASTTVTTDGYLEFEAINSSDSAKPPASELVKSRMKPKRPPLVTQASRTSIQKQPLTPRSSSESIINSQRSLSKTVSVCSPCEEGKTQIFSKISLNTRVPVGSVGSSGSIDTAGYDDACSVWNQRKLQSSASISESPPSSPSLSNVKPTATSSVAPDGYLEFDAIGADNSAQPALDTNKPSRSATSKARALNKQTAFDEGSTEEETIKEPVKLKSKILDSPKPVARIVPISREGWDTVIPPPEINKSDEEEGPFYINEAMNLSGDVTDDDVYEPVETPATKPAVKTPTSKPKVLEMKANKPPIPQVRYHTLKQNKSSNLTAETAITERQKSATLGSKLGLPRVSMAPSPNTRRRNIQESLNAQLQVPKPAKEEATSSELRPYINVDANSSEDLEQTIYENMASKECRELYENTGFGSEVF